MIRSRHLRPLGAAILIGALAACGASSTEPNDADLQIQETVDVAMVAGDAIAEDVSLMNTQEHALGQPLVAATRTGPWGTAGCTFDSGTGRHSCAPMMQGAVTITRSVLFLDAAGQPQQAYDPVTTASANFVTTMSGSVNRPHFSATFARHRDITVSGLAGDETQHVVNGTGTASTAHTQHSGGGMARSYAMSHTTTFAGVVIPVPRTAEGWPLSGTITRVVSFELEGARGGGREGTRTVVVTFNGTRFVPMTVNGRAFTLDLLTGDITPES